MRKRFLLLSLSMLCWIFPSTPYQCSAQQADGAIPITFHVTSIKKDQPEDTCVTGTCSATRFTVEGYARITGDLHSTRYVLTCIEFIQFGTNNVNPSMYCARLRANAAFDGKLYADVISFADDDDRKNASSHKGLMASYEIESQQEMP